MAQLFANNASTLLTGDITIGSTTLSVTAGDGVLFPAPTGQDFFLATIHNDDFSEWEIVRVSARSADTFTVSRAEEGTPQAWTTGARVSANLTKGTMELLQTLTAAAQSSADAAQVDADDALAQLSEGGTSGAAETLSFNAPSFDATEVDINTTAIGYFCMNGGASNVSGDQASPITHSYYDGGWITDSPYPAHIGLTPAAANKIQVFRNGVKVRLGDSGRGPLHNQGAAEGVWTWHGHLWIHFNPILQSGEDILIMGFAADTWTEMTPNIQVTNYSWLCGGYVSGVETAVVNRLDWATHVREIGTAMSYTSFDGSGGTTDGTDGRVFGGAGDNKDWVKMSVSAETWTSFILGLANDADKTGCSTNGTATWIYGCDGSSWETIQKIVHSTDVDSIITAQVANGYVRGDAFSNAAQTFGLYLPGPVSTRFEKYKLLYATEAISVTTTGTAAFNNGQYPGLHTFYDDIGYALTPHYTLDFSTETWAYELFTYGSNVIGSRETSHETVCDGGHYIIGEYHKMIHPTKVLVHYQTFDVIATDNTRAYQQIGSFSDSWGASK